jgi:hypothetical protein
MKPISEMSKLELIEELAAKLPHEVFVIFRHKDSWELEGLVDYYRYQPQVA